jgi:hypothetical protein
MFLVLPFEGEVRKASITLRVRRKRLMCQYISSPVVLRPSEPPFRSMSVRSGSRGVQIATIGRYQSDHLGIAVSFDPISSLEFFMPATRYPARG